MNPMRYVYIVIIAVLNYSGSFGFVFFLTEGG